MFKLNLTIVLRTLWKNRSITAINIGGLSVALAAFILVVLYVGHETTFDRENENYDNIYLVGRTLPDYSTNYTAPPLAKLISSNFPEVAAVGKMKGGFFEFPINSQKGRYYASNSVQMDYELAKMFKINPAGGLQKPVGLAIYLPKESMQALFPNENLNEQKQVIVGPKQAGDVRIVKGMIDRDQTHSNITFDLLIVADDLGKDEDLGFNNYNTYIQVKPGTDVSALSNKIDKLYKAEMAKGDSDPDWKWINSIHIFLDPLKNLHLQPKAGNNASYKVLIALSVLGLLILVIACINFTNLSIAQATKRAKEVGVKKVMGAHSAQLTVQFLLEILMQCTLAIGLGLIIAEIAMPKFNQLFLVNLNIWSQQSLLWQLPLILVLITFIAGIYPALVLSGFKPAAVLKGNFHTSRQNSWLRNGLVVVQFSVAVIFITGLLIINSQLKYMRTEDIGFKPEQVIAIKNMAIYSDPKVFAPFRDKMMKIRGVKSVTVANSIPDGSKTGGNSYTIDGKRESLNFLDVDFDYFETLNIKVKDGRTFSAHYPTDTTNAAILNESAVAKLNLANPIGKTITGCSIDYRIVGVVKDFKSQGFEKQVDPTIYTLKDPCGNYKTSIMVKVDEKQMAAVLATLKAEWSKINKLDGEDFRYQFLDELYGKLFQKQEQLQSIFFAAAMLTILIAILGLFAFARYMTNGRIKEIAVRKILGATDFQVLRLLNTSFFMIVLAANLVSWPVAYILTKKWLETFAYRIEVPVAPFAISALVTICLTVLTVSLQARAAVRANPVKALKYE
ncbi:MAG: FtsX-like permease family protein [Pedobacter sp.]|nr:FtsX-like permease family protein [Pedobacter sp.]MDQ8053272.1 FtsX-like permease family protein [Pedobacter sp.]